MADAEGSTGPSPTPADRVALLVAAMVVSLWRTARAPNDWAEAHWLLDYRFGFVKRGLPGQLLTWVTGLFGVPITETLIAGVGFGLLALFVATVMAVALRIAARDAWRPATVAVLVAFLTSPFAVLAGHLCGYFDHLFYLLGAASIALALRGRVWIGALVQVAALLVHESCILLIYPAFVLACVLRPARGAWLPLLLPIAMAGAMAVVLSTPPADFVAGYSAHLRAAGFVGGGMAENTPQMLTFTLWQMWQLVSNLFDHLRDRHLHAAWTMLPTVLVLGLGARRRWPERTAPRLLAAAVVVAPLSMHVVAWDVERIWSYAIMSAFLAAWVLTEVRATAPPTPAAVLPFAAAAIAVNLLATTLLFDGVEDRLGLGARATALVAVLAALVAVRSRSRGTR